MPRKPVPPSIRTVTRTVERARDDIHAPDLPQEGSWVGEDPGKIEPLLAKGPVLVHFFDFSQLNSVRTLPYLTGWYERYSPLGLVVIGVQSPRLPPANDRGALEAAIERLGIPYPVLLDSGMELWKLYGCEGWPSLFLWGRGGRLRWFHFGEGEYGPTEDAIRESLGPSSADSLPDPMEPIRETDVEGAEVIAPSPELFPGGDDPWTTGSGGSEFEIEYQAGSAWVTASGEGRLGVELDGEPLEAVLIEGPGLYRLAEHGRHGEHRMRITLEGDPSIWSVSFAPAPA